MPGFIIFWRFTRLQKNEKFMKPAKFQNSWMDSWDTALLTKILQLPSHESWIKTTLTSEYFYFYPMNSGPQFNSIFLHPKVHLKVHPNVPLKPILKRTTVWTSCFKNISSTKILGVLLSGALSGVLSGAKKCYWIGALQ